MFRGLKYSYVVPTSQENPEAHLLLINSAHQFINIKDVPAEIQDFVLDRIYNCKAAFWHKLGDVTYARTFSLAIGTFTGKERVKLDNVLGRKLGAFTEYMCIDHVPYATYGNYGLMENASHDGDTFLLAYINGILAYMFRLTDSITHEVEMELFRNCVHTPPEHIANPELDDTTKNAAISKLIKSGIGYAILAVAAFAAFWWLSMSDRLFLICCVFFLGSFAILVESVAAFRNIYKLKKKKSKHITGTITGKEKIDGFCYVQFNDLTWLAVHNRDYDKVDIGDQCILFIDRYIDIKEDRPTPIIRKSLLKLS